MMDRGSTPPVSSLVSRKSLSANGLLCAFSVVLVSVPVSVARFDRSVRGDIDPSLVDVPADRNRPFLGTARAQQIKNQFHEPERAGAALVPAENPAVASADNRTEIAPEIMKKARKIYAERCASCHGDKGNGDGPGAFAIKPRPRDYTDPEWQKTVTDEELAKAIVKGGVAVGKSYMMPANYDLRAKPDVTAALVAMVRSFATPTR